MHSARQCLSAGASFCKRACTNSTAASAHCHSTVVETSLPLEALMGKCHFPFSSFVGANSGERGAYSYPSESAVCCELTADFRSAKLTHIPHRRPHRISRNVHA